MPIKSDFVKPVKGIEEAKKRVAPLKNPDKVLSGQSSRMKALLNAPTESAILVDNDGTILAINEVGARRINSSVDKLINRGIFEYFPPHIAKARLDHIKEVVRTGKPVRFQDERDRRSTDNNMYPVFGSHGGVIAVAVYAKDITASIQKDKALVDREAQYQMLVETMNDGLGIADDQGLVSYVNDKFSEMIGYPKEEIVGRPVASFLDDENQKILEPQLSERRKGVTSSYEIEYTRKDNQKIATIMSARPIFDKERSIIGSFAVITDIENRKRIEKALRKSEEKYRSLVETTLDLVWELDSNAHFTYVNAKIKNLLGYEAKDLAGQSFTTLLAKHDIQSAINIFKNLSIDKKPIDVFEFRLIHKNGMEMVFEINAVPVLGSDGVFLGCKGISRDITKRKLAEKELAESEERYRVLVESSPDAITVIQDNVHKLINKEFTRLFGYSKKDVDKGLSALTIAKPKDMKEVQHRINTRIAGNKLSPDKFYIDCLSKKGENVPCESSAAQVQYNNQPASLVIFRDISKRKQAEEELQARAEDLEETNIALKVLLKQREKDKSEIEDKVLLNIEKLVMPDLERLKDSGLDERQKSYVNILESNLEEIATPFARELSAKMLKLTPAEIQIANFVKQGKSTKEIADLLNLSPKTIEAHRKNIRNKLGIRNKKSNLRSYLLNIGE